MNDSVQVEELKAKVLELELRVQELSRDSLTGVWGRGVLDQALGTEFARPRYPHRRMGVLMLDIDHFKKVNDTLGHPVGDTVLREVAQAIQGCVRTSDVLARYGGEEFCVLINRTNPGELFALGERICRAVRRIEWPEVTVSIGATIASERDDRNTVVKRADEALYEAKSNGRNRVQLRL